MGGWWKPDAVLTSTSPFTASGVLPNLGDIFEISEIGLQKVLAGLLPRPGTLSCSGLSFLVGLLRTHVYAASHARPQTGVDLTSISRTGGTGDAGDRYTGLDRFGRVVDQTWYDTAAGQSTDEFRYGYDADGDVLYRQNVADAVFSELYQYDNLHQLTSYQRGTLNGTGNGLVGSATDSQNWGLDALGNFTSVTTDGAAQMRAANQQNEITGVSGSGAVTYDANGNLTADGSGNTYVYDAWNRLVAAKNGGVTVAAYGYNGLGERITETRATTTTDLYYSSSWQVVEERTNGQLQGRNVWSPAGVDALVLRDQSSQLNGVLDQRLYVQQDANGNVTALLDVHGNVLERYVYQPYGAVTVLAPDWTPRGTGAYAWMYLYQGKRYDGWVGLYDSRGRVYLPSLGRPLQADPLGLGPDVNDYRWEGNGPTDRVDPSGLAAPGGFAPWGFHPRPVPRNFPEFVQEVNNTADAVRQAGDRVEIGAGQLVSRVKSLWPLWQGSPAQRAYERGYFRATGQHHPLFDLPTYPRFGEGDVPDYDTGRFWLQGFLDGRRQLEFGTSFDTEGRKYLEAAIQMASDGEGEAPCESESPSQTDAPAGRPSKPGVFDPADWAEDVARIRQESAARHGLKPGVDFEAMAISRKQALNRIEGLIGEGSERGIEAHIGKLTRRGSGPHIRAELEARLKEIERLAEHTGNKTQEEILQQVRAWRQRIAETPNVD